MRSRRRELRIMLLSAGLVGGAAIMGLPVTVGRAMRDVGRVRRRELCFLG